MTAFGFGGLAIWLAVHFGIRYYRKSRGEPIEGGGPGDPTDPNNRP